MKKGKVLVTGGAGYIGSHTVIALSEAGYEAVILDNFSNSNEKLFASLCEIIGYEPLLFKGSCLDFNLVESIFATNEFVGVIHFAAFKAVNESVENPISYYHNNITSLLTILEVMRISNCKKLVFSSSCTVYGDQENVVEVSEDTPLLPAASPYGWTKKMGEQIIEDTIKAYDMEAVLLRYFNPVGAHPSGKIGELPQGRPNNILPVITQTAAGVLPSFTIFGNDYPTKDGTCVRDFIHVCDIADAHVNALSFKGNKCEAFNLGTGKGTSVLELVNAFETVTSTPINYSFGEKRKGDIPAIFASTEKAKKLLSWEAKYSINEAVADAWRWEKYRLENEM